MKKKLLVLVAMLLCVVTVLASCASSMKFEKIVGDGTYNDENPTLTTTAKLDVNGEYDYADGDLVIFEDVNAETGISTYTVYNLATGATVYTVADSEKTEGNVTTTVEHEFEIVTQWETTWFVVFVETVTVTTTEVNGVPEIDEDETYTVSLRNAKGEEFATATDIYDLDGVETVLDLIVYNEKAYRIAEDGSIAHAFDMSALREMPRVTSKVGNYYYASVYTGEGSGMQVYNSNLELVAYYERPSYVSSSAEPMIAPLNNGNVLIQYSVLENLMAEDYTYIANGNKYTLYTFLLDVEKGKTKEIDLDYVVSYVAARDDAEGEMYWDVCGLNREIENIATVYPIENERVDMSNLAQKAVAMTNKGKVDGMIDGLIDNMMPGAIYQVATNRWIAGNYANQLFLLNENGDVLGEVTGFDVEEVMRAIYQGESVKPYFILNNKIYDWDLNVKYDMTANKIEDYEEMAHGVLMGNEDDEVLLYANGEVKTIIDKAAVEAGKREFVYLSEALYVIIDTATEGTTKYEVYNDVGTLLTTIDNADFNNANCIVRTADSNNAVLIAGTETVTVDNVPTVKTVYYRVG